MARQLFRSATFWVVLKKPHHLLAAVISLRQLGLGKPKRRGDAVSQTY